MTQTNINLYRAEQVREMDRMAIHDYGIPGETLMERAGATAFKLLQQQWPKARRLAVFCGPGNNGGDGYVIARLAHEHGLKVCLYQMAEVERLKGEALMAAQRLPKTGIEVLPWQAGQTLAAEVIVDAMLGTGLNGEVSAHYRSAIEAINASAIPVLAVDLPSGLHADTGGVLGVAVKADQTISFIAHKQGLFTGAALDHVGALHLADLAIPAELPTQFTPPACTLSYAGLKAALAPRRRDVHKGDCGRVLIIGGDQGYSGALRMAGEAALRAGAGMVTLVTRAAHADVLNIGRPELMVQGIEQAERLEPWLEQADVVAIGPGLGLTDWGREMFAVTLEGETRLVVDADGLNLLAQGEYRRSDWILTPHPGEAGRLLGSSAEAINADRYAAIAGLHRNYGGVVVLKGAGTLVCSDEGPIAVCTDGNPGMASGGMGDALTGIIAALWAQGLPQTTAASFGVCLHGAAADRAAQAGGERGMLATDLMPFIRQLVNP